MPTGTWSLGWATGDIVTAGEFRKGVGAIYDTTLGASAASIDISGIVATYAHLRLVLFARGDTAAGATQLLMRLNNDSGTSYQWQTLYGSASTPTAAEGLTATTMQLGNVPAASAGALMFGSAEFVIPYYAQTTNYKAVDAHVSYRTAATTGTGFVMRSAGWWTSGSAINRITVFPAAGNFVAGTRATLYAMGA